MYDKQSPVITTNPEIMDGKPVIKGTRIPVGRIIHLLKDGYTIESIHEEYPYVSIKTIEKVVDEVAEMVDKYQHASI